MVEHRDLRAAKMTPDEVEAHNAKARALKAATPKYSPDQITTSPKRIALEAEKATANAKAAEASAKPKVAAKAKPKPKPPAKAAEPEPNERAVKGGNKPPLVDLDEVARRMTEDYQEIVDRAEKRVAEARLLPKEMTDADEDDISDAIADVRGIAREAEAVRKTVNMIWARAKAVVDGHFAKAIDTPTLAGDVLYKRLNAHNRAKLEAERIRREAEATAAAEAAAKLEVKAATAKKPAKAAELASQAEAAKAVANEAAKAVDASAADMTRTKSSSGTLRTTRTEWKVEIDDYDKLDLNALRQYIPVASLETAVRAWAKRNAYKLKMEGVRIFEEDNVSLRR